MDQSGQGEMPKRYITTLSFYHEGEVPPTLESSVEQSREVIACAEDHGLTLIDGSTHRTREREAVESWTYGSEKTFRNLHAEAESRGMVWDRELGRPRELVGSSSPASSVS